VQFFDGTVSSTPMMAGDIVVKGWGKGE